MNILLWVLQGFVALMMLLPGFMKLSNNNQQLIQKGNGRMNWAEDISSLNMKLIGVVEVLAALGLTLPMLLGILPILTPIAAIGVIFTMLGALSLHIKRKDEPKSLVINFVILITAAYVAYGRLVLIPA
jgi:uncharacterized membrane protein YphA (DoxX/SURF4 family)